MTLILAMSVVALLWSATALVCVALCVSAARGDRSMGPGLSGNPRRFDRNLGRAA